MTMRGLEQRLTAVERELTALRELIHARPPTRWQTTMGAFEGDPEFEELVRLGAEYRQRQRSTDVPGAV
jgi:hypothetical protein